MRTRLLATSIALSGLLCACAAKSQGATPNLPESVSPGWRLTSFDRAAAPPYVPYPSSRTPSAQAEPPTKGPLNCWQATYAGPGAAQIWLCRYAMTSGAFDAWQRVRADTQTVKFQEGEYLVLVKSNDAHNADLTALMGTIQHALSGK